MSIERLFFAQLVRGQHGEELVALDQVTFSDQQLVDAPGDLRADDDLVRGDDAGEDDLGGTAVGVPVVNGSADDGEKQEGADDALHGI